MVAKREEPKVYKCVTLGMGVEGKELYEFSFMIDEDNENLFQAFVGLHLMPPCAVMNNKEPKSFEGLKESWLAQIYYLGNMTPLICVWFYTTKEEVKKLGEAMNNLMALNVPGCQAMITQGPEGDVIP